MMYIPCLENCENGVRSCRSRASVPPVSFLPSGGGRAGKHHHSTSEEKRDQLTSKLYIKKNALLNISSPHLRRMLQFDAV